MAFESRRTKSILPFLARAFICWERERERERKRERERGRSPIDVPIQQVQERGEDAGHSTRISGNRTTTTPTATITAIKGGGGDKIRGAPRGIPSRDIAPRCRHFNTRCTTLIFVEKERKRRDEEMNFGKGGELIFFFFFVTILWNLWNLWNLFIG